MQRHKLEHFPRREGDPAPLRFTVRRKAAYSDVDPMGYVWFGRYPLYMEAAGDALNQAAGLSHSALSAAGVLNSVAQLSVNYIRPILLDMEAEVTATLVWTEAAKLQYEFAIRSEAGLHAVAWAVNVFVEASSNQVFLAPPPLVESFRTKWREGGFACLQV